MTKLTSNVKIPKNSNFPITGAYLLIHAKLNLENLNLSFLKKGTEPQSFIGDECF